MPMGLFGPKKVKERADEYGKEGEKSKNCYAHKFEIGVPSNLVHVEHVGSCLDVGEVKMRAVEEVEEDTEIQEIKINPRPIPKPRKHRMMAHKTNDSTDIKSEIKEPPKTPPKKPGNGQSELVRNEGEKIPIIDKAGTREDDLKNGDRVVEVEGVLHLMTEDVNIPRILVLPSTHEGFGFVLKRKCDNDNISPEEPSLTVIESVSKDAIESKAGLQDGDYLLTINSVDVRKATHQSINKLIEESVDIMCIRVITVDVSKPPFPN